MSMLVKKRNKDPRPCPAGTARHRDFNRDVSGAAAVELALVVVPFFGLLLGAIQLFIVFQTQQVLETAAEKAGRIVLTGNARNLTQDAFKATVCRAMPAFVPCSGVFVDMQVATSFSTSDTSKPTLTYDANGNVTNNWAYQPGNAGQIVVLRILYQEPVIGIPKLNLRTQTNGTRLLMATSVFKNEVSQ